MDRVGFTIPSCLEYVVKGGEVFVGSYTRERSAISGMANFCKFLGNPHLNCFSLLVFTFDGCSRFEITAFADSMIETEIYPIVPPSFDPLVQSTALHILANETDMLPFMSCVVKNLIHILHLISTNLFSLQSLVLKLKLLSAVGNQDEV